MRSSQHKMGCHKDISQDTNESITQKKKKKISTAQENYNFSFTFCFFQPKKYPAPIEYVACLVLRFQYCYQEIQISQLEHNFKVRQLKIKLRSQLQS